jgi:hypothetical protein
MVLLDSPHFYESNGIILLANQVPGTRPSLSIFSYSDSTHFSKIFGISYMVVAIFITSIHGVFCNCELSRGHHDKSINQSMKFLTKFWVDKE